MKHGYFINQKNSVLGPFMSSTIALRMAQLVKGYWDCLLVTKDDKVNIITIASEYNKE